jgi:hypothetical protein
MRTAWVISEALQLLPTKVYGRLQDIAPTWGSWSTWREFTTDNCTCSEIRKARELLARAFQVVTNFHVPKAYYQELGEPKGVRLIEGLPRIDVEYQDDIIAVSIASQQYDLVLLLGFDLEQPESYSDQIYTIISGNADCQFVQIDAVKTAPERYQILTNFTCDSYENVLQLLS